MRTYCVEEIFEDIPGDEENLLMKIPPEICKELGWEPGDTLKIKIIEEVPCISIEKKIND